MMKVGKAAAVALGGGIILLQVANHNGYIKVNWDKLTKKADELGDRVEAETATRGPKLLDKVMFFFLMTHDVKSTSISIKTFIQSN